MKNKIVIIVFSAVCALLAGISAYLYRQYMSAQEKNAAYEREISQLNEKTKKATILQSISSQMENIAYQQKEISDEQREEAIHQSEIANQMRAASDIARQQAITAEQSAKASAEQAKVASQNAENQRQIADQRREQAEYQRRKADTLSIVSTAQSLGSQSVQRYHTKNYEMAELLAYASYYLMNRYGKNASVATIYQALSLTSKSSTDWLRHKSGVTAIVVNPGNRNIFATCDNYGTILMNTRRGNELASQTVVSNPDYDFRDIYFDANGNLYALSRNGCLYVKTSKGQAAQVFLPKARNMMRIMPMGNDRLLLVGQNALYSYDKRDSRVTGQKELSFSVSAAGNHNGDILLFDKSGKQYAVSSIENIRSRKMPFNETVTAYAFSKERNTSAYGTANGSVYVYRNGKLQKIESHLSRISHIDFNRLGMVTSSFDGMVKFCDLRYNRLTLQTVYECQYWIYCFTTGVTGGELWTGNRHGNITRTLTSIDVMAEKVKKNLKRNLTEDEWKRYIGTIIPYSKFK